MKHLLAVATFAVLALPCGIARAQGRFLLQYSDFGRSSDGLASVAQDFCPPTGRTPGGLRLPTAGVSGKPSFHEIDVGTAPLTALLYTGKPPKLFVDTDGDKDLSEEQAYEGTRVGGGGLFGGPTFYSFDPVAVKGPDGGAAEIRLGITAYAMGGEQFYLLVRPAGFCGGAVTLAGRSHQVRVVDANLNGRYDDAFAAGKGSSHDWLAVDVDADGRLRSSGGAGAEMMPLPRMLRVGDAYYTIAVEPDGSAIGAELAEPRFGALDMEPADAGMFVLSESGPYQLRGGDSPHQLPAGLYEPQSIALRRNDEKGTRWDIQGRWPDEPAVFEIREGETLAWKAGPPLTIRTAVDDYGQMASIGLEIVGQAGESYSADARRGGKSGPAPRLRILDESGKVLAAGTFEFG